MQRVSDWVAEKGRQVVEGTPWHLEGDEWCLAAAEVLFGPEEALEVVAWAMGPEVPDVEPVSWDVPPEPEVWVPDTSVEERFVEIALERVRVAEARAESTSWIPRFHTYHTSHTSHTSHS